MLITYLVIDDSDGFGAIVEIIDLVVITTKRFLAQKILLGASCPLENVGLMAALYLLFAQNWKDIIGKDSDAT